MDEKEYTGLDALLEIDVTDINGDESTVNDIIDKLNKVDRQELVNSLLSSPLGATGEFPEGKIDDSDQGELALGIKVDHEKNVVIMNFGTRVVWVGIPKEQALEMGQSLIDKANELQ